MQITEMLITGYDGEKAVFAVSLFPDNAKAVLTKPDENGETVVDSAWRHDTDAFVVIRSLLDEIVRAPAPASS